MVTTVRVELLLHRGSSTGPRQLRPDKEQLVLRSPFGTDASLSPEEEHEFHLNLALRFKLTFPGSEQIPLSRPLARTDTLCTRTGGPLRAVLASTYLKRHCLLVIHIYKLVGCMPVQVRLYGHCARWVNQSFRTRSFTLDVSGGLVHAEVCDLVGERLVMFRSSPSLLHGVLSGKHALDLMRLEIARSPTSQGSVKIARTTLKALIGRLQGEMSVSLQ